MATARFVERRIGPQLLRRRQKSSARSEVSQAHSHAHPLIEQVRPEVEAGARATLIPLAQALGVTNARIGFCGNIVDIDKLKDIKRLSDGSESPVAT